MEMKPRKPNRELLAAALLAVTTPLSLAGIFLPDFGCGPAAGVLLTLGILCFLFYLLEETRLKLLSLFSCLCMGGAYLLLCLLLPEPHGFETLRRLSAFPALLGMVYKCTDYFRPERERSLAGLFFFFGFLLFPINFSLLAMTLLDWDRFRPDFLPGSRRNPGEWMLLAGGTFGLGGLLWTLLLYRDDQTLFQKGQISVRELLFLALVPFYQMYWYGTRPFSRPKCRLSSKERKVFLFLCFIGLGVFAAARFQQALNQRNTGVPEPFAN